MIAIVGQGNVASHLYEALRERVKISPVNSHSPQELPEGTEIVILAVSDDAIKDVASKIPDTGALVAHTSGSVDIDVLKNKFHNSGVFYPLQTFTKDVGLNYKEIPVFVEGSSKENAKKLKSLANLFSENVKEIDSENRRKLHLASVFANNFTNALASISEDLLSDTNIDFRDLLPLMKAGIKKLETLSPREAQTGPAKRGDTGIIGKHLEMLKNQPRLQAIYSLLTEEIMDRNKN